MRARSAAWRWIATLLPLAGCGDPTSTEAGILAVTTATTGPSRDPDGYVVRVDGRTSRRAAAVDTVVMFLEETATHTVALGEISESCAVEGDSVLSIAVPQGDTAWANFEIRCGTTAGTLRITTVATGAELDPNGYQLAVSDLEQTIALPPNGVYITDLPSGHYGLVLSGNTANCEITGGATREADVLEGLTREVTFTATCPAAPPAGPGHEIAFASSRLPADGQAPNRVYLMNDDGTGLRPLDGAPLEDLIGLSWQPDGRTLTVVSRPRSDFFVLPNVLYTMDAQEGVLEALFEFNGGEVAWSPDGAVMAFSDSPEVDPFRHDEVYLLEATLPRDSARQLTSGLQHRSPTWSPDGTRLAYVEEGAGPGGFLDRIIVRSLADSVETPILADFPGSILHLAWSPAGTALAFHADPESDASDQIFAVPASGGAVTQLTRGPAANLGPAWSPDGRRIAFTSTRDGNAEIYVMDADGTNQTRLTNNPASDANPGWRP